MTNAAPIRIADAVAAEINTAVAAELFSVGNFTAERTYADWDADFSDLNDLSVDVVFRSQGTIGLIARNQLRQEPKIHIAVRKRNLERNANTGRLEKTAIDLLVTLLEEIYEYFAGKRNGVVLADESTANWDGSEAVTRWVNQAKLRKGLFEGYVEITFNIRKAV